MNDAFISYNWEIKTQVDILYRNLTNAGFKIWHDENKLSTDSQPLKAQLADAIDNSKIVICCITEAYCKSHVCNQEISFAESLAKPLIILMKRGHYDEQWPIKSAVIVCLTTHSQA